MIDQQVITNILIGIGVFIVCAVYTVVAALILSAMLKGPKE